MNAVQLSGEYSSIPEPWNRDNTELDRYKYERHPRFDRFFYLFFFLKLSEFACRLCRHFAGILFIMSCHKAYREDLKF